MRKAALVIALLAGLLAGVPVPAAAGPPRAVSVVLHGDLPGDTDCIVLKTSGGSTVDLEVGSVVRALSATTSEEFAVLWGQLRKVYDSSFVGTASSTVSALTMDSGKVTVLDQWTLEAQRLNGGLAVAVGEADQVVPAPDPANCI